MHLWQNPLFIFRALKNITFDVNRLCRINEKELLRYQNKLFRKMVKYAFSVPIYNDKYSNMNIRLTDIAGINEIKKLPLINKDDLRKGFPNKITPNGFKKYNNDLAVTSGSSGSPIGLYCEPMIQVKYLSTWIRILRTYKKNWLTTKTTAILDRGSINNFVKKNSRSTNQLNPSQINFQIPKWLKNIQLLDATENIESLAYKINEFKPTFLTAHPGILKAVASLKKDGIITQNVNPSFIASSGGLLDDHTRKYIENSFEAQVIDVYASTEGECTAFECPNGNYHVQSDIVYVEILNEKNLQVQPGETGKVVVTRLYGKGTPIIRYAGLNDMATYIIGNCDCGMTSQLIGKIEGRTADCIILPEGRMIPPYTFSSIIVDVLTFFGMDLIKQFQIVQEEINKIKIFIVRDQIFSDRMNIYEKALKEIKLRYKEKLGEHVSIDIIEVSEIKKTRKNQTIAPVVISYLNNKAYKYLDNY
jgi:phenylacetate-CoA ligase